ncbi:hypothetical protein BC455_18355 [Vibrio harveyi]|nr:hypothetical protein BC455_18355 [Vibrio harveyi]
MMKVKIERAQALFFNAVLYMDSLINYRPAKLPMRSSFKILFLIKFLRKKSVRYNKRWLYISIYILIELVGKVCRKCHPLKLWKFQTKI